jgi:hypothetical protein
LNKYTEESYHAIIGFTKDNFICLRRKQRAIFTRLFKQAFRQESYHFQIGGIVVKSAMQILPRETDKFIIPRIKNKLNNLLFLPILVANQ